MTINDPDAYVKSLWDWGCLEGCFGDTRIKPTDIDGFSERNGYALLLETKGPGVEIPEGQRRMFENLVKRGYHTVMVIWGHPGKPERLKIITPSKVYDFKADLNEFRRQVDAWFAWADRQDPP